MTAAAFCAAFVGACPASAQSLATPLGVPTAPSDVMGGPGGVAMPQYAQPPVQAAPMSSCDQSMLTFKSRRDKQLEQINNLVKAGKGKLDPVAACPKFRGLVAIESEMKAWMIKNKDWCSIPDELLESVKTGFAKTPTYEKNACAAAAMAKRAAEGGGPVQAQPSVKLPAGPL